MPRVPAFALFSVACLAGTFTVAADVTEAKVRFASDIQPLLAKHCILCHGPDEAEAGLRLDLASEATAELDSGTRAIVPGDAIQSELIRRVTSSNEAERMPPEGNPLSSDDVNRLTKWIEDGAGYETHWAYQSVVEPQLPDVHSDSWVRNPIDRFVLARMQQENLVPSPAADRPTLIKRLYYDLIGLPPHPSEVDSFVNSDDPNAYESLVDRLLASPRFGERWARHWLDMARYADSDGYEKDRPRPNAWRYRDWVIDAINLDLPYDEFTIEQLAGDLLPDASPMQRLATAFHRQTLTNTEGGTDQEEFRVEATFDRAETTAAVWLGLTMTCARCHSHKYDQISQHEYYQLFAFFNTTNESNLDVAISDVAFAEYEGQKKVHDEKIAELTNEYVLAKQQIQSEVDAWLADIAAQVAKAAETSIEYHVPVLLDVRATSKAEFEVLEDQSLLVTGLATTSEVPDTDKYTLVYEAPKFALTGLRIETLTHDSLPKNGPGRAPNGNFVLGEVQVSSSDDRNFKESTAIKLVTADADFSQSKFPPVGALSAKKGSGWAVSPNMGKDHVITFYPSSPESLPESSFLRIVLDQPYGGQHLVGRFRIALMSGFDPLRRLPRDIAKAVNLPAAARTPEQQQAIVDHVATLTPKTVKLAKRLAEVERAAPKSPMISAAVMTSAERATHVLHRGDFLQPAEKVNADTLAAINHTHPLVSRDANQPADRLDLARWLVGKEHPLTPRVSVNQVWSHLFGRGIVPTVNDFGVRGDLPTHPELLDWLAWQFPREMSWSRKTLIKSIVMSATYRQSSCHREDLRTVDPTNRLFSRQNRWRVEAEIVRDLSLCVSGLLSDKVGGPSVFPPLPTGVAELSYANNFKWQTSPGEDRYRRGMYTFFKRTSPHPTLINFDCPDSNTTRLSRETSNTPLQALATLNNDVYTEAAQAMAARVFSESIGEDSVRMNHALRLCTARPPADDEVESFISLLKSARNYYESHPEDASTISRVHAASEIPATETAAWVATLRMILNLDEFIVRD